MNENEVWNLAEAKDHFNELIESATHNGPQTIRLPSGCDLVVESVIAVVDAVSAQGQRPSLVSLFRESPLLGLRIPRTDTPSRELPFTFDFFDEDFLASDNEKPDGAGPDNS